MTFEECCLHCIENKELVSEFNRLSGCKLGMGQNEEAMPLFVAFVYECIWTRISQKSD